MGVPQATKETKGRDGRPPLKHSCAAGQTDPTLIEKSWAEFCLALVLCGPRKNARRRALVQSLPEISDSDACLDIGTGHGSLAHYFAKNGRWTFIDPDVRALAIAKHILRGNFVTEDALHFLATSNPFRLITCVDVILYIDRNLDRVARAAYAKLEPGGSFLVSGIAHSSGLLSRIRRWVGIESAIGAIANPGEQELGSILGAAGFCEIQTRHYCGPFTLVFQTALDFFTIRWPAQAGEITLRVTEAPRRLGASLALCKVVRVFTLLTFAIDSLLFFLPRYGYVLVARKSS